MQFSSSKVLVRVSMHCYVTCVFELHATFAWASPSPGNFARNSLEATSNHELTSLQLQRLWTVSKSDRRKLCASFVQSWPCRYADTAARRFGHSGALHTGGAVSLCVLSASARSPARPRRRPWVSRLGSADQAARLSETPVAFACWCLCGSETAIAFVGAKWAFWCVFWLHWCCWFQRLLFKGAQW